jgi:hypothetical protein
MIQNKVITITGAERHLLAFGLLAWPSNRPKRRSILPDALQNLDDCSCQM